MHTRPHSRREHSLFTFCDGVGHCHSIALSALLAVCRQIRRESASIFFDGNVFRLEIELKRPVSADVKSVRAVARFAMCSPEPHLNMLNLALWTEGTTER